MTGDILHHSESVGLKFADHLNTEAWPRFHKILSTWLQPVSPSPTRRASLNSCTHALNSIPEPPVRCRTLALWQPLAPKFPSSPVFRHLYFNTGPLHQCFKPGKCIGANKERADKDWEKQLVRYILWGDGRFKRSYWGKKSASCVVISAVRPCIIYLYQKWDLSTHSSVRELQFQLLQLLKIQSCCALPKI